MIPNAQVPFKHVRYRAIGLHLLLDEGKGIDGSKPLGIDQVSQLILTWWVWLVSVSGQETSQGGRNGRAHSTLPALSLKISTPPVLVDPTIPAAEAVSPDFDAQLQPTGQTSERTSKLIQTGGQRATFAICASILLLLNAAQPENLNSILYWRSANLDMGKCSALGSRSSCCRVVLSADFPWKWIPEFQCLSFSGADETRAERLAPPSAPLMDEVGQKPNCGGTTPNLKRSALTSSIRRFC